MKMSWKMSWVVNFGTYSSGNYGPTKPMFKVQRVDVTLIPYVVTIVLPLFVGNLYIFRMLHVR